MSPIHWLAVLVMLLFWRGIFRSIGSLLFGSSKKQNKRDHAFMRGLGEGLGALMAGSGMLDGPIVPAAPTQPRMPAEDLGKYGM